MRLRRRNRAQKRRPPAPFINIDDRPTPGEEIRESAAGIVFAVVVLGLPIAALAVALILQATWLPVAGGVAAIVLLLVVLSFTGPWPF